MFVDKLPADQGEIKSDKERRRATYRIRYPASLRDFENKGAVEALNKSRGDKQRVPVEDQKIRIDAKGASFELIAFSGCNFHVTSGRSASEWSDITFRRCSFRESFMGYIHFRRVTFVGCEFEKCDFSRSEFDQCSVVDCVFKGCTSYDVMFTRTIVDPGAFDNGNSFPADNYRTSSNVECEKDERRWADARIAAIRQMLVSNTEAMHADHADAAMVLLRKAEGGPRYWFVSIAMSLRNLVAFAAFFCAVLALLFILTGAEYQNVPMHVSSAGSWGRAIAGAVSTFFGFGYTNIKVCGGLELLVTGISAMGTLWYAGLTAFLLRRWVR